MAIEFLCNICKKPFKLYPSQLKKGLGKFCSRECYYESRIGKDAWNKGLKGWLSEEHHANLVKSIPERNKKHPISSEQARKNATKATIPRREQRYNWKGGKKKSRFGYIYMLASGHPRATKTGYVFEHILVMEQHIGRYLEKGEIIHHLNKDRTDNRIENLMITSNKEHHKFHPKKPRT